MKKSTILFLYLAMLFFAACKNDPPADAAAETPATEEALPAANPNETLNSLAGGNMAISPNLETSFIEWVGYKPGGNSHSGTIRLSGGSFNVIRGFLKQGYFDIDMNTLAVTNLAGQDKADLEGHLKNSDFFDVGKFPSGKFEITGVKDPDAGQTGITHIVTGNLTLKGVTKQITFPANIVVGGGMVNITTPEFTINRTDWGIQYKSGLIGTVKDELIADDVKLKIKVEAPLSVGE